MIVMTFLAVWLTITITIAPDTPMARVLRVCLVDRPAAWLDRVTPGHVVLAILILSLAGAAVWTGGADAARMLGMATPEMIGWIAMFDVATYLDVIVALASAGSMLRLRAVAAKLVAILPVAGRRRRGVTRTRRSRPGLHKAANDDGDSHPGRIAA